ncbi:glutathione S-transferase family protein [Undibacterium sp.]|uniref:glutathione S-transferase family protein n=1 Tax=Undibacterium sp. TaxID=1914977 RepID=UPI00272F570F|nr:glutathione S-transferase family protein [Undibacterium sp.]MDP1979134.1 glutathione S-transferase family protein [Undibacterium sp.]
MITLYGFGRVFPPVIGETRDLRIEWALEEIGLPYRVHGLDHTGGEHQGEVYSKISPFKLVPAIDDDGFIIAESGAILLYLAEKTGKLIPTDFEGRMRVVQWCFATLNTVERPMLEILLIDKFGGEHTEGRRAEMVKQAQRWLAGLEHQLEDRVWIAGTDFSVADILLTSVLRDIRKTDLIAAYPRLKDYLERAQARPAWQRTLSSYAQRLGVTVADIR